MIKTVFTYVSGVFVFFITRQHIENTFEHNAQQLLCYTEELKLYLSVEIMRT